MFTGSAFHVLVAKRQNRNAATGKCSFSHLRIGEAHLSLLTPGWQKLLESLYKKSFILIMKKSLLY